MYDTSQATACLTTVFLDLLKNGFPSMSDFEDEAIGMGHAVIAKAIGYALEAFDMEICTSLPEGCRIHDKRSRTLASEVGDITFSRHVCRDRHGNTEVPLDGFLDLPRGTRVSPGARSFLIEAGAEVSYAKAARLLARKGGSHVSAHLVMEALRQTGRACERDDIAAAQSLYVDGVLPKADTQASTVCLEADGTYIPLQSGGKVEVKAMVAYAGKGTDGTRPYRIRPIRHGCVGTPLQFWTQSVAALGTRFDLSKMEKCHAGFDGEGWCKQAGRYLKGGVVCDGSLDPFHVNRNISNCFDREPEAYHQVLECIWAGRAEDAAKLLEAYAEEGVARGSTSAAVATYLRNNAEFIKAGGVSLGTMEGEQEHLYKSRMTAVPCAWSVRGVSDMARIRSRIYSGRPLPRPTRESSLGEKRAMRRERNIEKALASTCIGRIQSSSGKGYEPPHQASLRNFKRDVIYAAGISSWVRVDDPQ